MPSRTRMEAHLSTSGQNNATSMQNAWQNAWRIIKCLAWVSSNSWCFECACSQSLRVGPCLAQVHSRRYQPCEQWSATWQVRERERERERERCLFRGFYLPIHWGLCEIMIIYGDPLWVFIWRVFLNVAQLHLVMSLRLVHQGMCASATRGRSRSLPSCHVISQSKQAGIGMHWNSWFHCCTVGQTVYLHNA